MGKILIVNTGPEVFAGTGARLSDRKSQPGASITEWAQAAAERLAEYRLNAVYACPVPGADETAGIVASRFNLEVKRLPGLENINIELPFEGSLESLREKVAAALDQLSLQHKKETVAIISQKTLSVIMILHFLHMHNRHFPQIAQEAGAINLFEVRFGVPSALFINDTCHLHGLI